MVGRLHRYTESRRTILVSQCLSGVLLAFGATGTAFRSANVRDIVGIWTKLRDGPACTMRTKLKAEALSAVHKKCASTLHRFMREQRLDGSEMSGIA